MSQTKTSHQESDTEKQQKPAKGETDLRNARAKAMYYAQKELRQLKIRPRQK